VAVCGQAACTTGRPSCTSYLRVSRKPARKKNICAAAPLSFCEHGPRVSQRQPRSAAGFWQSACRHAHPLARVGEDDAAGSAARQARAHQALDQLPADSPPLERGRDRHITHRRRERAVRHGPAEPTRARSGGWPQPRCSSGRGTSALTGAVRAALTWPGPRAGRSLAGRHPRRQRPPRAQTSAATPALCALA